MRWKKFRLKTLTSAEDVVIASLADVGIEGAEIEDKVPLSKDEQDQMFVDIMPEGPADDGIAYLNFYLNEDSDTEETLKTIREVLEDLRLFMDIGEGSIESSLTEDKDWINNWKQYFHQFTVGDMLITPSWEEVSQQDADKLVLHIDPGTAFGTGMHETTQLVLRQIRKYITPDTQILDVGTGSGILSIAALKMGAVHAVGTDLDINAVTAARENMISNDIPETDMDVLIGNLIDDPEIQNKVGYEKYDIVAANILADVLVMLTPQVVEHMKHDAVYITSGILNEKENVVREAVEKAGLQIEEVTYQGEWVSITARRP